MPRSATRRRRARRAALPRAGGGGGYPRTRAAGSRRRSRTTRACGSSPRARARTPRSLRASSRRARAVAVAAPPAVAAAGADAGGAAAAGADAAGADAAAPAARRAPGARARARDVGSLARLFASESPAAPPRLQYVRVGSLEAAFALQAALIDAAPEARRARASLARVSDPRRQHLERAREGGAGGDGGARAGAGRRARAVCRASSRPRRAGSSACLAAARELGCADMGPGRLAFGGSRSWGRATSRARRPRVRTAARRTRRRAWASAKEWDALSELPRRLLEGGAALRDIAALRFVLPLSERALEQAARRRKAARAHAAATSSGSRTWASSPPMTPRRLHGRYGGGLAVVAASEPRAARPRRRCGAAGRRASRHARAATVPGPGAAQVGDPARARATPDVRGGAGQRAARARARGVGAVVKWRRRLPRAAQILVHVERRRDKADRDDGGDRRPSAVAGATWRFSSPSRGTALAQPQPRWRPRARRPRRRSASAARARREELEAEPVEVAHDRAGLDGVDLEPRARRERVRCARAPTSQNPRLRAREGRSSGAFARAPLSYS